MPVARVEPSLRQCAIIEETLLRVLDDLQLNGRVDQRWLAIARTHFQQGFIAVDCAMHPPQRLSEQEYAELANTVNFQWPTLKSTS